MEQLTIPDTITYMIWQKVDKKRLMRKHIEAGLDYYRQTRGQEPTVVLVNDQHVAELDGFADVQISGRGYVQPNVAYVGREEACHGIDTK